MKIISILFGGGLLSTSQIVNGQNFYTDTNSFANALNSASISYDSVYTLPLRPPSSGTQESVGSTVTIGQTTYNQSQLYLFNDGYYGSNIYYLGGSASDLTLSIAGGGYTAIDFELGVFNGANPVQITVNNDSLNAITLSIPGSPDSTFVGIIDNTTPITSLSFHSVNSPGEEIDILSPSSGVITIPEPSTMALAGLGGIGLMALRRRK